MTIFSMDYLAQIRTMDGEAGIATASWAHPSWATPHHGARRELKPE